MVSKTALRKLTSLILCFMLVFPSALAADNGIDYQGHWAEDSIKVLFEKGFVTGYTDGSFKPDKEISRAEFMAIINRAFDFNEKAEISFEDVKEGEWHYEHVARAVKAGYIKGFTDGTMRPTQNITRQEAAVIIARILDIEKEADDMIIASLKDGNKIPEWSAKGIAAVISKGYINKNKDGSFDPAKPLTRAEMAFAVEKSYVKGIKKLYAKPGVFTGGNIDGSVKIDNKGITLMDSVINGDLILGEGIGDGDVHLLNVTVKGETLVKGGGENSIIIENCQFSKIIIIKEGNKVRILAKGNTSIDEVDVQSGAKLESENLTGEGFGYVTIAEGLDGDALVELIGNFESVEIRAEGIQVQATGGTIGNLEVAQGATNVNIELANDAKVTTFTTNAPATVTGTGKIETAQVNVSGTKIEAPVAKVEAAPGVKVDANVVKPEPTTPTTSGGGSSSGGGGRDKDDTPPTVVVSAISVEGAAKVGETLTAVTDPEKATVTYQWMRSDAAGGTYEDIIGATSKTYQLVAVDAGKYIKVKATGTGNYTGTKTSAEAGPVAEATDPAAAAKAAFLAALKDKAEAITAAEVEIVGENITVSFAKDVDIAEVYNAAEELLATFKEELQAAELTIILGEDEEQTFSLDDDVVDIALYLLDGMSPADFLAGEQTIEATYIAAATVEGVTFDLAGSLKFQAVADPAEAAKEAFLTALEGKAGAIEVAEVELDGEDISVTFESTVEISEVYNAAEELLSTFKEELDAAELIIKLSEDKEETFTLEDDVVDVALYLLDGLSPTDFLAGEQTIEATYIAAATVEGVTFTLAGTLKFQVVVEEPEALEIYESVVLKQNYDEIIVAGNNLVVNLGGYTAQVLTITGSNITLKNGTVINLTIAGGVENVTLENISDDEGGTHTFAGGGSGSIVFSGNTQLKGIINITAPDPIEIRSESSSVGIYGNVIVKTIKSVVINTSIQGDVEVQAASESIAIKKEVAKIVALANTVIKIDESIEEDKRPKLEKAKDVKAFAVIIDEDGVETGEEVEFEENEDLIPAEVVIITIENIEAEVKVGDAFNLPTTVEAVMSDGTQKDKAVIWSPSTVDTSEEGTFMFTGIVLGYAGSAKLVLTVTELPTNYTLTYIAGENGSITGDTKQTVEHGEDGTVVMAVPNEGYCFVEWSDGIKTASRTDTDVMTDITVTAEFVINEYTVTFEDYDGTVLKTQMVKHGEDATAPVDPKREGYTFIGWDKGFDNVTSDLVVTALYCYNELTTLGEMIGVVRERTRPAYTSEIEEWNTYWGNFEVALVTAEGQYNNLKDQYPLTPEEESALTEVRQDLLRAVEILDGIEDFDEALGDREDPKGLVETVYERSLVISDGFQSGRLRCHYDKETGDFYWMLSGYMQEQDLYSGTTGTGMNPGLQNVMLSDSITKLQSGSHTVEIYKEDGTRRTKKELEGEGIKLAISWLKENEIDDWYYCGMVGLVIDCQLIGETSDGTEFERTYTFHFVDGGVELFDSNYRYCVIDGVVRISGYNILTYSAGGNGSIEGDVEQIVEYGKSGTEVKAIPNTGYRFVQWSDGSTENPRTDTNVTEYISVTAEFAANEYTVSFDAQEGTVDPKTKSVTYDSSYGDLPTPEKTGYTFVGWFTDKTEGIKVEADTIVTETSNHTLYARWSPRDDTAYKIEHYQQDVIGDGYTLKDTEDLIGTTDANVIATAKEYTGFTVNEEHPNWIASGNIAADGSLVLKLFYDRDTFTVNFESNGGSDVGAITGVRYGATIIEPEAPTKIGYTLAGWFTETGLINEWVFESDMVMATTILYAKWDANTDTAYTVEHYQQNIDDDDYTKFETTEHAGTTDTMAVAQAKIYTGFTENTTYEGRVASGNIAADGSLVLKLYYDREIYNIDFIDHDDSVIKSETVRYMGSATAPTQPEREGYTFTGWDRDFENITGNLSVKAVYSINQYTITFDSAGGSAVAEITDDYGATITAPSAPTRDGYTFTGWDKDIPESMPAEDMTITAQWTANEYSITYELDGGTNHEDNPTTYTIETETITLNDATKTGYSFEGWHDKAEEGTKVTEIPQGSTGDIILYAYWTAKQYTVTFDAQNGTESETQQVTYDAAYGTLPTPTKTGHEFRGWFTQADGGIEVNAETIVETANDHTLYAQWTVNQYTITFDSAGGSAVDSITEDFGSEITAPANPTKQGYTFDGWDPELPETMPAKDLELTAKWVPRTDTAYAVEHYQQDVTGDGYGLVEADTESLTGTTDATATATAKEYTGFTLNGNESTMSGTIAADGSLVLKLYYDRVTFTVSFESNGGSDVDAITGVRYEVTISAPTEPTKTGYTFGGWFKEEELVNAWNFDEDQVIGEITLYAKWEPTAATSVEILIDALPGVAGLTLDDLNDVEEAQVAYEELSMEDKGLVDSDLVTKVNGLVAKIGQLVLEDVDTRFEDARLQLQYENTGIESIEYEGRKATFFIDDPDKKVHNFLNSGVDQLFATMFKDVVEMRLGDDETWHDIEEGPMGAISAAARLVSAMLDIPFNPPLGDFTKLAEAKLSELQGKSIDIDLKIVRCIKEYIGSYAVEFKGIDCTVTVIAPEGGVTGGGKYEIGSEVEITITPPDGKEIDTFSVDGENKKSELVDGKYTFNIKSDVTVKVTYAWKKYTVTFKDHDGEELKSQKVEHGKNAIAPTEPTRIGYTFTGWDVSFDNVTEDLTVTATYSINQYTITFDTDGGSAVESITQDYGTDVAAPANPTKEGYDFNGWSPALPETMPAENIELTAQWQAIEYSITYNLDNGTNHEDNPTNYTIEDETITLKAATKIGYDFAGWYDAATEGNKVTEIAKGSTGDKTLYARWSANEYTVTFDAQGGKVEPASQQVTYDAAYGTLPTPTKTGHTFQGWFTAATGGTEVIADTILTTAEDHTLYAQWKINQYTITFDTAGGTSIAPITQDYGTDVAAPANPTKPGYNFKSWSLALPQTMPAEDITITAQWEAVDYSITYELDGGTNHVDNPASYTIEDTITLGAATKAGYTFAGWWNDETGGSQVTKIEQGTTGGITLYARWKPTQATIVEQMITALPAVGTLTLGDLEAVEDADAAYEALSAEEQESVATNLVSKLNDAVAKIEELVLADVDARFESARQALQCEGTGIQKVEYEDQVATFFIDNLDKKIEGFLASGVADLFDELFQDVVGMKLGDDEEWYVIETGDFGPIEAGARIVAKMLGLQYESLLDIMSELSAAEMSALKDKSIDIDLKIVPGIREYIGSYKVEFTGIELTVTITGTTEGVTGAGTYEIGSEVTITVTPPPGLEVDVFTVNYADKKDELINGEYKFIVTEETTVKVTYAEALIPTSIFLSGPDSMEIKPSGNATETYYATVRNQNGKPIPGATATWSLKEAVAGVSIDTATGEVTVADTTMVTEFTVVATSSTHPGVYAEKTVTLTKEKNTDATLSDLTVDGVTIAGFDQDTLTYSVELVVGTTEIPTVAATATDINAAVDIMQAMALLAPNNKATVKVTAEDGTTIKTYSITFTVKANQDQDAPVGLTGKAPTSAANNDGKIASVADTMEYKLVTDTEWIPVSTGAIEITGLSAGAYHVRYAAKTGYNPSPLTEVIVPAYVAPEYTVIFSVTGENGTLTAQVDSQAISSGAQVEEGKTVVFTAAPSAGYQVKEWTLGGQTVAGETGVVYTLENLESAATVTVEFKVATYTVTFQAPDGTVINMQEVEHGGSATAPEDPEGVGYTFGGWDKEFDNITSDLVVIAIYIPSSVGDLNDLILAATDRERPDYTIDIVEWNTYWGGVQSKLAAAETVYNQLKGKEVLTPEEETQLGNAKHELQTAMEIIDGIEDFDVAFGDRVSPKGLEITVNDRSRVEGDGFQPHRLRAYYDKEKGDFYWLLSRYQQGQQFYAGTAGTGMNPGLKSVIASNTLIKVASGEYVIEIYKEDGTRKTEAELDNDAIFLALDWVDGKYSETYSYLAGRVRDFNLVGKTSDGTEYQRSYTFYFVDSGVYLFDPYFDYHVIGEVVQRDFRGFTIINATQNIGYSDSSIQAAIDVANPGDKIYVAAGTYSESVTINKSITLIGDYGDERFMGPGPNPPVLDGISLTGVPGFQIAAGVSDVTIKGFEIKNYDSGGIVGQGAGINNVKIEHNYIHDVGNDGVLGSTSGTQMLINWTVSQNLIKGFAGLGINLENVGDSLISENKISSLASEGSIAIEVMSRAVGNSITVSGVTISNNEITDYPNGAVNILAWAEGASSATVENINIGNNTFPGRAVNVEAWAEGASSATVKTVNINSNSIVFQDRAVCIAVQAADASSSATVEGVSIDGNTITGNITGIDVHKQGSGTTKLQNFTITGNNLTINNPKEAGCAIHLADVGGASNFSNNTITITGTIENGGNAFDGVDISGSATGSWTITGNELDGNNVGTASSGIHLRSSLPASAALNMEENTVTKWAQGILTDALVTGTTVELRRNRIFGNSSYGISNASSGATIDAILNYWGDKSGPYHSTNSSGLGNSVSDKVDFAPWHQDADFISLSDGTVVNIDKEKYYHSIQAAIDEAYPGDTIHVTAGTYYESVTINKSIILTGDCGDVGLPGPGSNAPILDGTGQGDHKHGFYINGDTASNVTIEGFVIRNFSGAEASGIFGHGVGVTDITLRYNYIHDVAAHGVRAFNAYKQESMTGWGVKHNVIEKFGGGGGCGIYFVGVSGSLISNNKIFNPTVNCSAILLKAEVTSNVHHIMSDITISGNEIIDYPDRAIYVLANANYSNTHATIENVNIAGNTVTGDAQAITFWAYGDGQNELKDMNITDNNITVNYPDSGGIEAVYLDNIRGSSNFSGNTLNVVGDGGGYCDGIIICGKDTGSWTLDNNYIDGHNKKSSYGVYYFWIPAAAPLNMNRNTFTGWDLGIRGHEGTEQATLRSNLIYGNNMGTNIYGPTIDATLNYWGDKSGPFHSTNQEGLGNAVTDGVLFAPWYADESCTIPSGEVAEGAFALAVDGAFGETFTVTFNGNGGTPTITEVEVEGEATVDTLPTVTRDGYTFVEWNTLHDGTGEVFTTETAVTADMTVYAIWEETVAGLPTIVSIADVDDLEVGYGTVEDDTIATLAATTIIKDSDSATHTVALSWTIADYDGNIAGDYTATGTFVLPEGVHQADPAMRLEVTATVTVKAEAVVEPLEEIFTVTFDGNEGTPATTEVEVEGEATVETLPTVDRDGYTFVVWNTAQDGAGEMFTTETTVTADMTVYAIWEEAEKDNEEQIETEEPVGEPGVEADENVVDEQVETGTDVGVINDTQEDE